MENESDRVLEEGRCVGKERFEKLKCVIKNMGDRDIRKGKMNYEWTGAFVSRGGKGNREYLILEDWSLYQGYFR